MKRIYLDYAATTPMDKEVEKAMRPFRQLADGKFGNPNSLHYFGQEARKAVDESREKIAKILGCDFGEIIFTGSATEANNMALRGAIRALIQNVKIKNQNDNLKFKNNSPKANTEIFHFDIYTLNFRPRIIISNVEHESVLETCRNLEREGVELIYLSVNKNGIVNFKKLKESLNENAVLVSIMYANNEIGTAQSIAEIAKIVKTFRDAKQRIHANAANNPSQNSHRFVVSHRLPLFHSDCVQAFQFLNCNVDDLGIDLMTLSAHKIYGPKGIGALYARNLQPASQGSKFPTGQATYNLQPIITGGGQEFGLRSGTENVPAIVGFAKAMELADKNREKEFKRISKLADYFWEGLKKICPEAKINGVSISDANKSRIRTNDTNETSRHSRGLALSSCRLPNIINIYFPKQNAEELLIKLDLNGVAISSGSACAAFSAKPSHVLKALGYPENRIKSSLRFSFGKFTTKMEIAKTLKILKKVLN